MSAVEIDFGHKAEGRLNDEFGLKIASARGVFSLGAASYFEAPTSVQAQITPGSTVQVGAFTSIAGGAIGNVKIGRYVSIATGVVIGSHEHPVDWLSTSRLTHYPQMHDWDRFCAGERAADVRAKRRPFHGSCPMTNIGNDVWIGHSVFIKSGVSIGDGAVIGARSVVTKDIPPYSVVIGQPAKVHKMRFEAPLVERLMAFRWWRFSLLDENVYGIKFESPTDSLDVMESLAEAGVIQEYQPETYTPERLKSLFA